MNPAPQHAFNGLVGQSLAMRNIRALIEKVGPSRSPVLLLGESGTGKEVVARALHNVSPRGTFVPIDCGSLVGPLLESELFGHLKGAFTGANENKKGLIELANNGTAFFDEIGDIPLELQVKLLRLLEEREYRPVGSLVRHKVEIRVVAATHHNLAADVEGKIFRQDLFYRLNVITIRLPPLRDRKEDIPLLVEAFLSRRGKLFTFSDEVMETLMLHDWPGNIRELHNCVDRMTAVSDGPLLDMVDLPSAVRFATETAGGVANAACFVHQNGRRAPSTREQVVRMSEVERRAISEALEVTHGDRGEAAMLLGIGRTTLYRKLKEYEHELPEAARLYRR